MAYIVDLTLIMQTIFWLVTVHKAPITRRLVKVACKVYDKSAARADVHNRIEKYVKDASMSDRMRDGALGEIVDIIRSHRIDTEAMFKSKDEFGGLDLSGNDDESWDVENKPTRATG